MLFPQLLVNAVLCTTLNSTSQLNFKLSSETNKRFFKCIAALHLNRTST